MSDKAEDTLPETGDVQNIQNIDQIREIILGPQMRNMGDIMFGSQLKEIEKRFTKLETRMQDENDILRSEISSRLDTLESYIKREVASLAELIAGESREREEVSRNFTYELSKYANDTDAKVKKSDADLQQAKSEMRDSLLEQSKTLLAELQSTRINLTESIDSASSVLQAEKTDRSDLAEMFKDVAMRLHGDDK